jgi:cytidine deaminase
MDSDTRLEELKAQALGAMEQAYAPYSGFRVGAAVETAGGRIHRGCNVENASFPVTLCAERVALGAAVAAGERDIRRVFIVSSSAAPIAPCGVCRQALAEFGADAEVVSEGADGLRVVWRLGDLLPERFTLRDRDARRAAGDAPR